MGEDRPLGDMEDRVASNPFRILHTESSMELGGQEFRVLSEACGMRDRGHFVVLAVPSGSQIEIRARQQGLLVEAVNMNRVRWLWLIWVFLKIVSKHKINVVSTHGSIDSWTASIAGRVSKRKPLIVRTRHKSTPISNTMRHQWLYAKLPDVVVTTGEIVRRNVITQLRLPEQGVVSIPSGVDIQKFQAMHQDHIEFSQISREPGDCVIGTVSFLREYKGLLYFLRAANLVRAKFPHVKFVIVGDGPEYDFLKEESKKLGLANHLTMTGFREDVADLLSEMDIFVLSSTEAEGLPQALTQAMAMRKAVIATNVGSVAEVVDDQKTGLLVAPRNIEELVEAMSALVLHQEIRERLGQAARVCIEMSYSVHAMLSHTESLYERLQNSMNQPLPRPA